MKKMLKKITYALMLSLLFTACGGGGNDGGTEPTAADAPFTTIDTEANDGNTEPTADTKAPVITLVGTDANISVGDTYIDAGATATDNVDGDLTATIITINPVDTTTAGTYIVTYDVNDTAGNSAVQVSRTITVNVATNITHNGTTYGFVTSPHTGKVWLDRNLGAARVCESFNDTACYGDYYQWGRDFDGHQDSTNGTTETQATDVNTAGNDFITSSTSYSYDWAKIADSNGNLRSANWSKTDGTSVCPIGYRVPTTVELRAETLDNGVTNRDTAFANFLKLPSAGYHYSFVGSMRNVGSWSDMWSSSVSGSKGSGMICGPDSAVWGNYGRANGFPVRCLRD